jgi:ATP-dependent Clp protease ATP-binding subunit ClpX
MVDLKTFGLIPELLGRLPVVSYLQPLDIEALKLILTTPKNALIKQYHKLFEMEDIELSFSDEALDYIVLRAMDFNLGARGLRGICEAVLTDAMFELPGTDTKSLFVDLPYVMAKLKKSKYNMAAMKAA